MPKLHRYPPRGYPLGGRRRRRPAARGAYRYGWGLITTLFLALPATAQTLDLPGNARQTAARHADPDRYLLPTGPFADGTLPSRAIEGAISRSAWRINSQDLTTLQIIAPLRDQLTRAGYAVGFECADIQCGGFDFRFGTEVFAAPAMHVDLFDYRFLAATRQSAKGEENATLLVSRTGNSAYIQIVQTAPPGAAPPKTTQKAPAVATKSTGADAPRGGDLIAALETHGHVVLSDLDFPSGSSDLGPGPFDSLATLAAYLATNPDRRIALVGHTDAVGALSGNIALSKRRATSVKQRLIAKHGADKSRIDAEGMGYLSPITTNQNDAGRTRNRRVEVILLNTK